VENSKLLESATLTLASATEELAGAQRNLEYNQKRQLDESISAEDLEKVNTKVQEFTDLVNTLTRTVSNAKGDITRATSNKEKADAVRTELKNLITLRETFDKAEAKIKDQVARIKEIEGQKEMLETQFGPEDQEYIDQMAELDTQMEQVGVDPTTLETV